MEEPSYRFGVPSSGAVLLGLTGHQLVAMAAGFTVLMGGLLAGAGPAVALCGLCGPIAAALYCWLPVRGRPACHWSTPLLRHGTMLVTGGRWNAAVPVVTAGPDGQRRDRTTVALPPELGRLSWLEVSQGSWDAGVVVEGPGRQRQLTVVLRTYGRQRCVLLSPGERSRLISAWGSVLAATAVDGSPVRRIELIERARPARERAPEPPAGARPEVLADYRALLGRVQAASVGHEVYVALQLAGSGANEEEAAALAVGEARSVAGRLSQVGLGAEPLSRLALAGLVRSYSSLGGLCGGPEGAVPAGRRVRWDHLEIDGWWHRAYAVMAWPRSPVTAGWMRPLLEEAPPGAVRTVTLHYQPVAMVVALKRAQGTRTRVLAAQLHRNRMGIVDSRIESHEKADGESREAELIAGYAEHRLGAVVLISAPDQATLETAGRAVTSQAVAAHLDLRVLYGQQDLGWAAAMPLGRMRLTGAM
jgi:hypothetical protein